MIHLFFYIIRPSTHLEFRTDNPNTIKYVTPATGSIPDSFESMTREEFNQVAHNPPKQDRSNTLDYSRISNYGPTLRTRTITSHRQPLLDSYD